MSDKTEPKEKLILIVDDDDTVIDFLKFAIEKDGFCTIIAKDGEEALLKAETDRPDLIVLDMMIPKKGGYEVIKSLQIGEGKNIPIIIITGRFVDDLYKHTIMLEPNVKDYLLKPVKSPYLLHRIHSILGTISPDEKIAEEKKRSLEERLKPKKIEEEKEE